MATARAARFATDSAGNTVDDVQRFHKRLHELRVGWMASRAEVGNLTFGEYLIALSIHNQEKNNG
jgi:hypothetical protein